MVCQSALSIELQFYHPLHILGSTNDSSPKSECAKQIYVVHIQKTHFTGYDTYLVKSIYVGSFIEYTHIALS